MSARQKKLSQMPPTLLMYMQAKGFSGKSYIPTGRIPKIINAVSSDTAKLIDARDKLRAEDPTSARLPEIQRNINISIRDHRQQKWLGHLDKCQPGSKQMWNTVKSLSNPPRKPENQSVAFQNKHYLDSKKLQTN